MNPLSFEQMFSMGQAGPATRAPVQANTPMEIPEPDMLDMGGQVPVQANTPATTKTTGNAGGQTGNIDSWSQWMSDPNNAMGLVMLFGSLFSSMMNNVGRR